jgi:Flp pilus assembly protein TadG
MTRLAIWRDTSGASAVEFALTAPAFIMLVVGSILVGLGMWAQAGLQHGTEAAARCASVNTLLCGTVDNIKTYAAQQSYGLNPPATTFTVSTPACGNQVSASYAFPLVTSFFGSMTLTAQACFPA